MKIGIYNVGRKWHIWIDCFCSPFLYDWCRVASGWTRCSNFEFYLNVLWQTQGRSGQSRAHVSEAKPVTCGDDDDTPLFTYTSDFSVHFTGRLVDFMGTVFKWFVQMTIYAGEWQTSGFMRGTAWTPARCPHTEHKCGSLNFRSGVVVVGTALRNSLNRHGLDKQIQPTFLLFIWIFVPTFALHRRLYFAQVTTKLPSNEIRYDAIQHRNRTK